MSINTKKIQISFLIVNYNSSKVLAECINSLKNIAKKYSYEIIIGNNDNEFIELNDKKIKIINNSKNLGFGKANNIIAKVAVGRVLIFINPDTHSFNFDFCDIINLLNDDVGIIAPTILNNKGNYEKWSYGKTVSPLTIIANNIFKFKNLCHDKKYCSVGWVSGAVFCIKRQLFNNIGGFDERFFLYYEDVDLCKRVLKLNFKIIKSDKFSVMHIGGTSMTKKSIQKKYYYDSQHLYISKYYGKILANILKFLRKITHGI